MIFSDLDLKLFNARYPIKFQISSIQSNNKITRLQRTGPIEIEIGLLFYYVKAIG